MTEPNHNLAKPKRPYKKGRSKGINLPHGARKTAPRRRKFLPYEEARAFVCSLNLKTGGRFRFILQVNEILMLLYKTTRFGFL